MQERYIYVSFSYEDRTRVLEYINKLKSMGYRLLCCDDVQAGAESKEAIKEKIQNSNCIIVFLSKASICSENVNREIQFATTLGKKIVRVYLEDNRVSNEMYMRITQSIVCKEYVDDTVLEKLEKIEAIGACREKSEPDCFISALEKPIEAQTIQHPAQPPALDERVKHVQGYNLSASSDERVYKRVKKKSVKQKIKDLFGGYKMTDVNFSVVAPAKFEKDNYTIVDIYAFEEAFRDVIEQAKAKRAEHEGEIKITESGYLQAKIGAKITIRLTSPDIEISENEESRIWVGKYVKFDFPIFLPKDFRKRSVLFTAAIYFDGVLATRISFSAYCNGFTQQRPHLIQKNVHSAFISYASHDRERVALILQGMRRSRPDLDVFFDVETLKTGDAWERILRDEIDRRDVLYLCWSKSAKESPWVEREWRYALEKKGLDGIEPIPLVLPKECPPPEELKSKHFGAVELFYQ